MPLPKALQGERWTEKTARKVLPLIIWCAKNGRTITYGQLDREVVVRDWGHHVMSVVYGHPAGAIGDALIETEQECGQRIPPLNAIIVNATTGLPGKGVNDYLQRWIESDINVDNMSLDAKRAVVEDIHAAIFSYEYWDDILAKYELEEITDGFSPEDMREDVISQPTRGGWSNEGESEEHKNLKDFIVNNPHIIGLEDDFPKGQTEYQFASSDKADIVFGNGRKLIGVEVKSVLSNDADLNRGIFQCVKYQALLRAEQKASNTPPTARAILVTENQLPISLQNLADILDIKVITYKVN
ncbi:MAG: hypothetical protein GY797_36025 [Deltaproteobacteria bacterium]|nr:hypothetical protein [Deltaproteobacteria bacterium]